MPPPASEATANAHEINMYFGNSNFQHSEVPTMGVLLVNLGTPDAPTAKALRPYLRDFLRDPRVIELPRWRWFPILYSFILTFRPRKSAALYREVWTKEGSPLLVYSRQQRDLLKEQLARETGMTIPVELGMCYGNPTIEQALKSLNSQNVRQVLVVPLYPQYSGTTTAASFDAVTRELQKWRWIPEFRMAMNYHDHPLYIEALADTVQSEWKKIGSPEKLLMSFHGIPKRYFTSGDPYHCHCLKTGRLLAERLGLKPEEYVVAFQSIFGREEWIKPNTIDTVTELGKKGLKNLHIICPGFTSDCLETIEEIDVQNREAFLEAGGEKFHYIPCLNTHPKFIECLSSLALEKSSDWLAALHDRQTAPKETDALYRKVAGI